MGKQTCEATKRAVFIIYKMQMPADALFRLVNKERHEGGEAPFSYGSRLGNNIYKVCINRYYTDINTTNIEGNTLVVSPDRTKIYSSTSNLPPDRSGI